MLKALSRRILHLIIVNFILSFAILFAQCTQHIKYEAKHGVIRVVPKAILDASREIILKGGTASSSPIHIIRKGESLFLKRGDVRDVYYIKADVIERFFKILSSEVNFFFITNKFSHLPLYSLSENEAFSIRFVGDHSEILLQTYFGCMDATGERQYVRRGNVASTVISIEDVLSAFLTTEPSFWVDMQLYKEKLKNDHITSIDYSDEKMPLVRTLKDDALFAELEDALKALTMIDVYDGIARERSDSRRIRLGLEHGGKLDMVITPLDSGDFIFWDNRGGTYILSSYSHKRLMEKINNFAYAF